MYWSTSLIVICCVNSLGCESECLSKCDPSAPIEFVKRDGTRLTGFSGWISFDGTTYNVDCPGSATRLDDGVAMFSCGPSGFTRAAIGRIPEPDYPAPFEFEITETGSASVYSGNTTVVFDRAREGCYGSCPYADAVQITVD